MALLPEITEIVPATWTLTDVMTALHAHFSVSTKNTVDLVSGSGASAAFSIQSIADAGWQLVFRRTAAATMYVSIEPSGSITDVGNTVTPPTGTSSDWSGETGGLFTMTAMAAGAKIWLCEYDDAITILFKSTAGTYWNPSIHAGKVYDPNFPSVNIPRGRDGLAVLLGYPTAYTSTNTMTSYTSQSLVHIATGIWTSPDCDEPMTTASLDMENIFYVGFVVPSRIALRIKRSFGNSSSQVGFSLGLLRYMFRRPVSAAPLVRVDLDNTTELAFIHGNYLGNTAAHTALWPWRRDKTP